MIKLQNLFIFFFTILPCVTSQSPIGCNRSCPNGEFNQVPYPFGFSSGCDIQLNCTSNGTVLIGEFPIQQFNSDKLIVTLPTKCGRSADTFGHLYSDHYAPMSANAILMENCTEQTTNCMLPVPISQFRMAIANCSIHGYGNTSCYAGDVRTGMFLDYGNVTGMGCRFLLTGFVSKRVGGIGPPPSMTRAVELGWWVKGSCNCSDGADCTQIVSPVDGSDGFRCNCKSWLDGDGYKSSIGCQKFKGSKGIMHSREWKLVISFSSAIVAIMLLLIVIQKKPWDTRKSADHKIEKFISNYGSLAPKRYNYSEIKKFTKSFLEKLGQGGYGSVYKGELPDRQLVAVKLLNEATGDGEDFINEVASIGRTSHVNIVTLLGFCVEGKKRALMYEFMSNGSLDKFLCGDGSHLDWYTLFQIAKGIPKGLEYLHQGCNTRIVHFDIKPHNILLDQEFVPKISDFGLAKLCKKKESVVSVLGARGTAGYMAPEVFFKSLGGASHKSDVYSYGMMVLEMTGAHKRNKASKTTTSHEEYFPDWIYKQVETGGNLGDYGVKTEEDEELARKMMIVSLWCIQSDPLDRPSITKVMEMLEGSFESLEVPPKRFWSSPIRPAQVTSLSATHSSGSKGASTVHGYVSLPNPHKAKPSSSIALPDPSLSF